MRIFSEVVSNYQEEDTGRIAIDAYWKNQEEGVVVAWVEKTGLVILGEHSKAVYLGCELVQEQIREAVIRQLKENAVITAQVNSKLITQAISSPQEYVLRLKESLSTLRLGFEALSTLLSKKSEFNIATEDFLSHEHPFPGLSISELAAEVAHWEKDATKRLDSSLVIPADYVSVWDGGEERRTSCKIDLMTMQVFDVEQSDDVEDLDHLDEEYVESYVGTGKIYYDFEIEGGYKVVKGRRVDDDSV